MLAKSEKDKILLKLEHYCAYRERCHQEVRNKLLKMKVYGDDLEEIISALIENNFLNEERFAKSYARGKFRMNHWGWIKIKQNLLLKNISDYCIKKANEEIDEEDYKATAIMLAKKYLLDYKTSQKHITRERTYRRLYRRGFESEIINYAIDKILENESPGKSYFF